MSLRKIVTRIIYIFFYIFCAWVTVCVGLILIWYIIGPSWEDTLEGLIPVEKVEIISSGHGRAIFGYDYWVHFVIRLRQEDDVHEVIQRIHEIGADTCGWQAGYERFTENDNIPDRCKKYFNEYNPEYRLNFHENGYSGVMSIIVGKEGYMYVSYTRISPDRDREVW